MFYDDNLEAIKAKKGYLYSRMNKETGKEKIDSRNNEVEEISIVSTKDNSTAVKIKYKGNDYRLNSLYSPQQEARKWAGQYNVKNIGSVFVMFGLGNGIFVRELMSRLKEGHLLLIYEPSPAIFFHILKHSDMTDIITAPNVSITVEGINDNEIKNLLMSYINWINLKAQVICIHPQYDTIFLESLQIFYKIILDNNNRTIVNNNTDMAISSKIIDNTLRNIKFLKKCNIVTDLIGKFPEDVPAIIVAAGPSLDKNIEELKRAKGKAVIFAVDTAVKYLLARDILPDFIVTLDPGKSLHHLADERCKDLPLFSRIDSRTDALAANKKKIILYNIEGYIKNLLDLLGKNTGKFSAGGSVATGAFSICETLGFKRIILVGQDLAYAGDSTHAGGLKVDVGGAGKFLETVEDIYGNPIKTRYDWYVYIKWFEDAVDLFDGEEVIDATEGGAKIHGTMIMSLREAIDKYCLKEVDCNRVVEQLPPMMKTEEIPLLEQLFQLHLTALDEIQEKSQEAAKISAALLEKYQRSLGETTSSTLKNKRLMEINQSMQAKEIYELVDWDIAAATKEHLAELYMMTEDDKENKLSTYKDAQAVYKAVAKSADRIKPLLEEGIKQFIEMQ